MANARTRTAKTAEMTIKKIAEPFILCFGGVIFNSTRAEKKKKGG
jgi:hypothetical protein